MIMDMGLFAKFILLFTTFKATTLFVNGERECGNLSIMNRGITAGVTVRMQFYPATNFTHIFEQRNYRWILHDKTNSWVVYAERAISKISRVSEENYMLTIQGVRAEDEGVYRVECWYGSINNVTWLRSNSVDLELQEPTSITTTLTPIDIVTATSKGNIFTSVGKGPSQSTTKPLGNVAPITDDDLSDDNGSGATVIACVVSGVAVITVATVILVLIHKKRRGLKKESNNNEEKAGFIEDNTTNEYATVTECSNPQDLSGHCNPMAIDVDPYNTIEQPIVRADTTACDIQSSSNNTERIIENYSTVIPKSLRKTNQIRKSYENIAEQSQDEYATVVPKSKRINSNNTCNETNKVDNLGKAEYASVIPKSKRKTVTNRQGKDEKTEGNITINTNLNADKGEKDVYASVETKSKKKAKDEKANKRDKTKKKNALGTTDFADIALRLESHRLRDQWHSTPDLLNPTGNQYSNILLSSMHDLSVDSKSQFSKPVPNDQRLLDIHGLDSVRRKELAQGAAVGHEYDVICPIQRRKTKLKELQYIQIDHVEVSSIRTQSTESLDSQPVQYSDIDFTKKAFIAPKRYPPPPSAKK